MSSAEDDSGGWLAGSPRFVTTQWKVVMSAAQSGDAQLAALEQLCRAYWYPLYAYVRRRGRGPDDARDLTQEFFARLLEKNWLADFELDTGRFRSFILTALNRFLANEFDRTQAAKRGSGRLVFSLDRDQAEGRYAHEPSTDETPEKVFDRRWALAVLQVALTRVAEEMNATGKVLQFEQLSPFLSREVEDGEYGAVAKRLGLNVGAVSVAVHRLRQRYREVVREEIAATLTDAAQLDEEMRYLFAVLRG